MRDNTSQLILAIENHPVRSRRTTIVDLSTFHNWVLVVWPRHGKVEALVVLVFVRVVVFFTTGRFEAGTLLHGGVHFVLGVADATAGVGTVISLRLL